MEKETIMSYQDFCEILKQLTELKHMAKFVTCPMDILTKADELKNEIQDAFCDTDDNLSRWERGETCTFVSPETGKRIFLSVGKDTETLYHFLCFCREIAMHRRVPETYKEYLAYLLSKTQGRG